MELFLDCLPCLLRQALDAARMSTKNIIVQEQIIRDSIDILSHYQQYRNSPDIARAIHKVVKIHTGIYDPYLKIKERDLRTAKEVYSLLKSSFNNENGLHFVLRASAIGNTIDSALYNNIKLEECMEKELEKSFAIYDYDLFEEKLQTAKNLLIIGDNTGETMFDKLLIERLTQLDIIYAVRSEPIINDATVIEAYASGLDQLSNVISTGCNAPGAILEDCSEEFINIFNNADIIISKGQGNYEALSEQKGIFFLLKAKCPMIANKLKVGLNDYVFKYSSGKY